MGTLGGSNGDGWPAEGGGQPDGLPGLPPEWGTIVIPDDPAELADEAAEVRREMRRQARRRAWRRRLGLPPRPADEQSQPSLGLPLLIMSIAVIATLTSLFVVAWPGRTDRAVLEPLASEGVAFSTPATGTPAISALPDLALADAGGGAIRLAELVPAALLLVDGCATCDELVSATVAAAPDPVTVLVVDRTVPTLATSLAAVHRLADPHGRLRDTLGLDPPDQLAAVVLVARDGEIITVLTAVDSVDSFSTALAGLR